MANPQIENGHIDIANEIAEAFAKYFPGNGEAQVLWAILRKTYGWHKKSDLISNSQIQQLTGLSRRRIIVCLQNLEAKNIIVIKRKRGDKGLNLPNEISFQKNYDLWVVTEKSQYYSKDLKTHRNRYQKLKDGIVTENEGSDVNMQRVVTENENDGKFTSPTKESITKENITKENNMHGTKITFNNQIFKFENIPKEKIDKWKEAFLNCNVDIEIKKMEAWLAANPERLKKNYEKFIVNWLSRTHPELISGAKGEENGKNKGNNGRYIPITGKRKFTGLNANAGEW